MRQVGKSFWADWREADGSRRRQAFPTPEAATAFETLRKKQAAAGSKPKSQAERRGSGQDEAASSMLHSYNLPDYRLEQPEFALPRETTGEQVQDRVEGELKAPAPPLREPK